MILKHLRFCKDLGASASGKILTITSSVVHAFYLLFWYYTSEGVFSSCWPASVLWEINKTQLLGRTQLSCQNIDHNFLINLLEIECIQFYAVVVHSINICAVRLQFGDCGIALSGETAQTWHIKWRCIHTKFRIRYAGRALSLLHRLCIW